MQQDSTTPTPDDYPQSMRQHVIDLRESLAERDRLLAALTAEYKSMQQQLADYQARELVLRKALIAYDPPMPPLLEGETPDQYCDRLTGADKTGRVPYPEHRNRQCSIGYHEECSDPKGIDCKCPCHQFEALRDTALAVLDGGEEALL